jgi:hypothetical protein
MTTRTRFLRSIKPLGLAGTTPHHFPPPSSLLHSFGASTIPSLRHYRSSIRQTPLSQRGYYNWLCRGDNTILPVFSSGRRTVLEQKKAFQERRSKRKMALPSSNQDTSEKEVPAHLDEKAQLSEKHFLLSSADASSSLPDSTIPGPPGSEGGRRGSSDSTPTLVIPPSYA